MTWCRKAFLITGPIIGPVIRSIDAFVVVIFNQQLNKQSSCHRFAIKWRSCDVVAMFVKSPTGMLETREFFNSAKWYYQGYLHCLMWITASPSDYVMSKLYLQLGYTGELQSLLIIVIVLINLTSRKLSFFIVSILFIHCNYTLLLLLFALVSRLKWCFILPSTTKLSFSIDVVMTLSISYSLSNTQCSIYNKKK